MTTPVQTIVNYEITVSDDPSEMPILSFTHDGDVQISSVEVGLNGSLLVDLSSLENPESLHRLELLMPATGWSQIEGPIGFSLVRITTDGEVMDVRPFSMERSDRSPTLALS